MTRAAKRRQKTPLLVATPEHPSDLSRSLQLQVSARMPVKDGTKRWSVTKNPCVSDAVAAASPIDGGQSHSHSESKSQTPPTHISISARDNLRKQPRGPTEREDLGALRAFLEDDPAPVQETTPTPKSHFDWEESSDGESLHRFIGKSDMRSFQRATKRLHAATHGDIGTSNPSSRIFGIGPSVDDWMENAQQYAQKKSDESSPVPHQSPGSWKLKRMSVLKLFSDPVWSDENDTTGSIGNGKATRTTPTPTSSLISSYKSSPDTRSLATPDRTLKTDHFVDLKAANGTPLPIGSVDRWPISGEKFQIQSGPSPELLGIFAPRQKNTPGTPHSLNSRGSEISTPSLHQRYERPQLPESWRLPEVGHGPTAPASTSDPFLGDVVGHTANGGLFTSSTPKDDSVRSFPVHSPSLTNLSRPMRDQTPTRNKGYPRSPQDPGWDAAVRHVKRLVQEEEKREAMEMRQQQKEDDAAVKRMQRMNAARKAILRGSQFGLQTRKPIIDMTDEEIEAVGSLAIAHEVAPPTPRKTGLLGSMFTRMLGTAQEKEDLVETVRSQLDKHKSLQLLGSTASNEHMYASEEITKQFDEVLRLLRGPDSNRSGSALASPSIATQDAGVDEQGNDYDSSSAQVANGPTSIGLGILSPDQQRSKVAKNPPSLGMSEIRGEENVRGAGLVQLEEGDSGDGSSWHTESIYSQDDIDLDHATSATSIVTSAERSPATGPELTTEGDITHDQAHNATSEDDPSARPAPLSIRVLKIKGSAAQLRPADSNSFFPDRQASFHAKIQEVSRLQRAHVEHQSHPALRGKFEEEDLSSTDTKRTSFSPSNTLKELKESRTTSEIEDLPSQRLNEVDEGHATGDLRQTTFDKTHANGDNYRAAYSAVTAGFETTWPLEYHANREPAVDVDIQKLRQDVCLEPLRLACGNNAPKHPHHPFNWTHEKVMCREMHYSASQVAQTPSSVSGSRGRLVDNGSHHIKSGPTNPRPNTKQCPLCGARCCRIANLEVTSKIMTSSDLAEELVRSKAQQRINHLQSQHPDGVEDYETFVDCQLCERSICPRCAKRCDEKTCEAIVCSGCASMTDRCPVHYFI